MKCEICHENTAETAIGTDGDGEELYVCKACAKREQMRRRKRRERTRKAQDTAVKNNGGDKAPPFIEAFFNAVTDMVDGIHRAAKAQENGGADPEDEMFTPLDNVKVAAPYLLRGYLHLEGLHLIGEIEAVHRAVFALGLRLDGVSMDGVNDIGHIYQLSYCKNYALARRAMNEIVEQERNARIRLFEEMPRILDDALCRSLAILKNCRLLSVGEYFDLLSPLRIAAMEDMLVGIKTREIERILKSLNIEADAFKPRQLPEERDAADAALADEVNRRFEDVVIDDD